MLKKIYLGYASICLSALRFFLLMAVCIGTGILFVYPLWKLADSQPGLYTIAFASLLCIFISVFAFNRIRAALRKDARRFIISLSRKATILGGILCSIGLVLNYQRAFAGLVVLLTIAVYGFLAFGLSTNMKNETTQK